MALKDSMSILIENIELLSAWPTQFFTRGVHLLFSTFPVILAFLFHFLYSSWNWQSQLFLRLSCCENVLCLVSKCSVLVALNRHLIAWSRSQLKYVLRQLVLLIHVDLGQDLSFPYGLKHKIFTFRSKTHDASKLSLT